MQLSVLQYLRKNNVFVEFLRFVWLVIGKFFRFIFARTMWSDGKSKPQRLDSVDFVPERDIKFYLTTQLNPDEPQIITHNDKQSLKESFYNDLNKTRILIHGWLDNGLNGHITSAGRRAYLQKGDFNVISLDWSAGADTPNYFKSRSLVPPVGQFLAQFIDFLEENTATKTSEMYLIGHSLGAHIAGIAGKHIKGRLNTIHGLDPAGPFFFTFQPKERLDVTDASYVEVIHTSYSGFQKEIGYADFYVNGGKVQPGCNVLMNCSHMRSIAYWEESINSDLGFYGVPLHDSSIVDDSYDIVRDTVKMGGEPSNQGKARGSYKLETNDKSPFAKGPVEYKIKEDSEKISFL